MILNEEKNYFTNSNLYIIRLINRIYYLMSLLDEETARKLNEELEAIHEEFRNAQDAFSAIANGLEKNAPFKGFQAMALKGYEQDLESFLETLSKYKQTNSKNNLLEIIFSKINFYSLMLEKRNIKIEDFKDLTDYIRKLIYNFNDEALELFSAEINMLFMETLRLVKEENLETLVNNTNNYFYPSLIVYAEKYLFEVMCVSEGEELLQLKTLKAELSEKEYLIVLFQKTISLYMLSHETLMHKTK